MEIWIACPIRRLEIINRDLQKALDFAYVPRKRKDDNHVTILNAGPTRGPDHFCAPSHGANKHTFGKIDVANMVACNRGC